jgi:transposase-like protein
MQAKKYNAEFKEEAVRIAERDGVEAACEKLGVSKHNIYDWRRAKRLQEANLPVKASTMKNLLPGETLEEGFKRVSKERDELAEATYILKI